MDYVKIYEAWGEEEEKVIESLLRSNNINILVKSQITPLTHPFTIDGLGSFKIFVKPEDVKEAEEILNIYTDKKRGGE